MNYTRVRPVLVALACGALASMGCSETEIQGVTLDTDLNTEALMLPLARGSNSELTDVWAVGNGYHYDVLSSTDDFLNDGTANGEIELSTSDYGDRTRAGNAWNQALEASWAGLQAAARMAEVLDEATFNSSPLVARVYLNSGLAERMLGDAFCEAAYNFGPSGGFLLPGSGEFDSSRPVPRDSIFQRSATILQLGLEAAERAVAAGSETPDNDPLFDPQRLVYVAHGGLAQAYMAMASLGRDPAANWALAVQHAQQVPIDFVESSSHHELVERNELWDITWNNDDVTMWGAVINGEVVGTPATALWESDPRVDVTHCGDFADPSAGIGSSIINNRACAPNRDHRAESNDVPDWAPNKYDEEGSDVEMVTGTEMVLIEAEAALVAGNLTLFTEHINELRDHYGLTPIAEPATAGSLEWPNAEDDAWSILDRERYLELWLEGRRAFDLSRWDHPWYSEGKALIPRHAARLTGPRPFTCYPIPNAECNLNPDLNCPQLNN